MIVRRTKYIVRVLCIMLSCIIMISSTSTVYATSTVDSLEGEASDLQKDLDKTKQNLDAVAAEIDRITAHIVEVKASLAEAKANKQIQYEAMRLRMVCIYETGNTGILHALLSSDSLADFLNRAEYISMVNKYDRNALLELQETMETISAQEQALAKDQEALLQLQEALQSQVNDTSEKLQICKDKLEKAKAEAEKPVEMSEPKPEPNPEPSPEPEPNPENDETVPDVNFDVSQKDLKDFAALLECEAGTSHEQGILAVASVVVNRMKHRRYPNTLHGVMYQSGQFPPVRGSKFARILKRGVNPTCLRIAKEALAGKNNVGNCLSFRAASSGHSGKKIGGNVFF